MYAIRSYYELHQQETPDLDADHLSKIEVPVTVAWGEASRPLFRIASLCSRKGAGASKLKLGEPSWSS